MLNFLLRRHLELSDGSLVDVTKMEHKVVDGLEDKVLDICDFFLKA